MTWLRRLPTGLCGTLLLCWALGASGELRLDRTTSDAGLTLSYQWQDADRHEQQLAFTLNADALATQSFRPYREDMANAEVLQALRKAASGLPTGVQVTFLGAPHEARYAVRARDNETARQASQTLADAASQRRQAFLEQFHYATLTQKNGDTGVIPDHLYYIDNAIPELTPVVNAIRQKFSGDDPYAVVAFLLPWLQSIPYETMENRFANPVADYRPPLRVLADNRGDCDGKAALMAAVLRALYPDLGLAMVYLPEHALVAVHLPHAGSERYLSLAGRRLLLAEVVGPAMLPIGTVSPRSETLIAAGNYSLREIPAQQP